MSLACECHFHLAWLTIAPPLCPFEVGKPSHFVNESLVITATAAAAVLCLFGIVAFACRRRMKTLELRRERDREYLGERCLALKHKRKGKGAWPPNADPCCWGEPRPCRGNVCAR